LAAKRLPILGKIGAKPKTHKAVMHIEEMDKAVKSMILLGV